MDLPNGILLAYLVSVAELRAPFLPCPAAAFREASLTAWVSLGLPRMTVSSMTCRPGVGASDPVLRNSPVFGRCAAASAASAAASCALADSTASCAAFSSASDAADRPAFGVASPADSTNSTESVDPAAAARAALDSRSSTAALRERRRILAAPRFETSSILSMVYTSALSARISATWSVVMASRPQPKELSCTSSSPG